MTLLLVLAACSAPPAEDTGKAGEADADTDTDTDTDADSDSDADADADTNTTCADANLGSALGAAVAEGENQGAGNDYEGEGCGNRGAEDVAYAWTAPATATYVFDTGGSTYDTVLRIFDETCTVQTECNDDGPAGGSELVETLDAGVTVMIVVDSYDITYYGHYVLNITDASGE